jgi:periplasmic protein TonB
MQNMMTKALFCAAISFAPQAAMARHGGPAPDAITVTAGPSVAEWTAHVAQGLDDHLSYPKQIGTGDYAEGAVRVAFRCSESGTPADVSVVQSSRSRDLDQAAVYAVSHIPTLHPLPEGVGHDRPMEAWVFFASDQDAIIKLKRGFQRQAQIAAASRAGQAQLASLTPIVIASR